VFAKVGAVAVQAAAEVRTAWVTASAGPRTFGPEVA
jgi:hypothetical protein